MECCQRYKRILARVWLRQWLDLHPQLSVSVSELQLAYDMTRCIQTHLIAVLIQQLWRSYCSISISDPIWSHSVSVKALVRPSHCIGSVVDLFRWIPFHSLLPVVEVGFASRSFGLEPRGSTMIAARLPPRSCPALSAWRTSESSLSLWPCRQRHPRRQRFRPGNALHAASAIGATNDHAVSCRACNRCTSAVKAVFELSCRTQGL